MSMMDERREDGLLPMTRVAVLKEEQPGTEGAVQVRC